MVVVDDAAIGADGHVDAGLLEVLVAGAADVDERGGLAAADALGLAGDADGAAADTDLDEVRTAVCQEAEALGVDDVAGTDLDGVAVVGANPLDGALLPLGEALRGIDAQNVCACLDEQGHALGVVARVDARADHVALVGIEQLVGVGLVGIVVLAEDDADQVIVIIDDRQGVELLIPDQIVGILQGDVLVAHDELGAGRHELGDLLGVVVAARAVIAAGDDAEQLAARRAVVGDGHGGVAGALLELHDLLHRHIRGEGGIGLDEARLVVLDGLDHGGLGLGRLGAVDEGQAALGGQGDAHVHAGHRLHDRGDHGDVKGDRGLLAALEARQRRLQRNIVRHAL